MSMPTPATARAGAAALDVKRLRQDFPALKQEINGRPLAYLDNAATAQKPAAVIEAVARYYREDNSNVHRGVHTLSERATAAYEGARETMRGFVGAASTREIVFVRGTTEAINLVAQAWARPRLQPGDEILITHLEHHSNIVPWQMVCEQTGATLRVAPINACGEVRLDEFERLLGERTKLVAIGHVSNALGTINPVRQMIERAHAREVPVLVDGAQATPHMAVDVQALGADFYALSGHKMFGPTGIGVLYAREALLDAMPPWQGGGDMIKAVSFDGTVYNDLPYKFEAGTPNIGGAVGLGAAADYIAGVGQAQIAAYESDLLAYTEDRLAEVDGLRLIGTAANKAAVASFVIDGVHAHDLGTIVDHHGVAIRAGHHCAMPVMEFFGLAATARASLAFYNTREEIDALVEALREAKNIFG